MLVTTHAAFFVPGAFCTVLLMLTIMTQQKKLRPGEVSYIAQVHRARRKLSGFKI